MKRIILASKSPRRQELLKKIVDSFEIKVSEKPEISPKHSSLKNVPVYLAKQKASEIFKDNKDAIVIGADTVVISHHEMLGKPKDKNDVRRMITMLSNSTHIVVTGVCIKSSKTTKTFKSVTKVTFKKLSDEEINNYCELETVYDKAGAYAIQGEAKELITGIKGDYYNVVGLPVEKLNKHLRSILK